MTSPRPTEKSNPRSIGIDRMSIREILAVILGRAKCSRDEAGGSE